LVFVAGGGTSAGGVGNTVTITPYTELT
jgi:hypothetical protein